MGQHLHLVYGRVSGFMCQGTACTQSGMPCAGMALLLGQDSRGGEDKRSLQMARQACRAYLVPIPAPRAAAMATRWATTAW